jgi:hypothetical protein
MDLREVCTNLCLAIAMLFASAKQIKVLPMTPRVSMDF